MKKATIKDVAKEAGVSVATVSAYLNGVTIRRENYAKVEQAVKKLDYSMNYVAKSMKTQKSYTVGVVVPQLSDAYSGRIISEIEKTMYTSQYNVIVCDSRDAAEKEIERIHFMVSRNIDGLFLFPVQDQYDGLQLPAGFPMIVLDGRIPGYDAVNTDDRESVKALVCLLADKGHRRIGFFNGPLHFYTAGVRYQGYLDGLQECGLPLREELVSNRSFGRDVRPAMEKMLSLAEPPTAVIASNYYTTLGVLQYTREQKIRVPEELSVAGVDRMEELGLICPDLTVVERSASAMGACAAERMLKRLSSAQGQLPPEELLLPNTLTVGGTVGSLRRQRNVAASAAVPARIQEKAEDKKNQEKDMDFFLL